MIDSDALRKAAAALSRLENEIIDEEPCSMFLKAVLSPQQDEVVIECNAEGLITFASMLIDLAIKRENGGHFHIDRNSILDEGNCKLVVTYSPAPWES